MKTNNHLPGWIRAHRNVALTLLLLTAWASCARVQTQQVWNKREGPVIPHDTFPGDCSLCHVSENWNTLKSDFIFDHEKEAGVALNGAHAQAQCLRCHNDRGPVAQFAARGCAGCHIDKHQGRLGINCNDCHDELSWRPTNAIASHNRTRFPLIGAHAATQCTDCHQGAQSGNFSGLETSCVACHMNDFQATDSPNHAAGGFSTDCRDCHTAITWQGASITHPSTMPLTGGHGGLNCNQCHVGKNFQGLSPECASCHMNDFQATSSPNHAASMFSTDCKQCHMSTNSWQGAIFDHTNSFPLSGGHAGLDCSSCHVGGNFKGLSNDCVSCHAKDFQATKSPNHVASGFSTNCKQCHKNTNSWQGATFDHPKSMPLTGGHGGLNCNECHVGGNFKGLSTDCVSCHIQDYQATSSPKHAASGFSTDCKQCHKNTNTWQGATFSHTASMPLTGGHAGLNCNECHVGGNYKGLSTDCVSCHMSDYQATKNPNHAASGFSTDCKQCHKNTTSWQGATFNHPASFPLGGGHGGLNCNACHVGGNFKGLSTSCVSCHMSDYQASKNPNHVASGFSTDCKQCHKNNNSWLGATFSHPVSFPLSGGHGGLDCSNCHTGGNYKDLSTDCVSCHFSDYQGTRNPNHASSGFSTDCRVCHKNTNSWQGATFNHSFPITSGAHKNLDCNDCHLNPGNQQQFSCTHCHEHTQSKMNDKHKEVGGYSWTSQACLDCHPNGRH